MLLSLGRDYNDLQDHRLQNVQVNLAIIVIKKCDDRSDNSNKRDLEQSQSFKLMC